MLPNLPRFSLPHDVPDAALIRRLAVRLVCEDCGANDEGRLLDGGRQRADTIVIGGGPAGLSASLFLARYRRSTLTFHDNSPRNLYSHGIHGFALALLEFRSWGTSRSLSSRRFPVRQNKRIAV